MNIELLDEEGENLAVRSFLMQYSCDRALTIGAMRKHMDMSGWPLQYCPEFARIGDYDSQHLTKAGAQLWIRHLISMEPTVKESLQVAPESVLRNWLVVIHDNERALGDRLQSISARINSLLQGDPVDKFAPYQARIVEQSLPPFQSRVQPWLLVCFGETIAADVIERNHRFLEEALELVQACGATADEAHQLVDYTFGRPVGDPVQEVGGVMITLAALCLARDMDMHAAGETELARIWTKVEAIRAKQAAKPQFGPLPGYSAPAPYQTTQETK